MFAFCPSCRQPAALDLRASMFDPAYDFYSCAPCSLYWTVEKISGRTNLLPASPRRGDRGVTALADSTR